MEFDNDDDQTPTYSTKEYDDDSSKSSSKNNSDMIPSTGGKSIQDWLNIFQIFILIGVTIFTIGQFTGTSDTDLAAYIWFAIGVSITWILSIRSMAVEVKGEDNQLGWLSAAKNASLMLPTLGTLLPISILIYVLIKVRPILQNNISNLPPQFFWFNKLTFFLVIMQLFILGQFYKNVLNKDNNETNSKGLWIAAMILFSVLTAAATVELYVIITAFITDG
jgi:hypothetical protein